MSLKDPSQWRGSSWMIRAERHEKMLALLGALNLSSPKALIEALTENTDETLSALAPIAQKYLAAQAKVPKAAEQRKELASKLKGMTPEQLAKVMAAAAEV